MPSTTPNRRSVFPFRRIHDVARLPRLERLEDRTAPANTHDVFNLGDFYRYGGEIVPLDRRADIVTIQVDSAHPDQIVSGLIAPDGPLNGFRIVRTLQANEWMLSCPRSSPLGPNLTFSDESDERLAQVASTAGVTWVAPVFQAPKAISWMAVTDEIIIALKDGVDGATFFAGDRRFSTYRPLDGTADQFVANLAEGAGSATLEMSEQLLADARVAWAEPNFWQDWKKFFAPNDPLFGEQWHLENTVNDADVDATEAWDVIQGGSSNITIAVVDDGMELAHPDLKANIFVNPGEIAGNSIDDDGNGWIDDVNGWDFTTNDNNPGASSPDDAHATAVAGVAAAIGNNALGVSGIAYKSKILPIRIFNGNQVASDANIASAIYYSAGRTKSGSGQWNSANLANHSWGGGFADSTITGAFTWASNNAKNNVGIPSLISSGNGYSAKVSFPANLSSSLSGVFAVGASTNDDVRSGYSNYGTGLDFVAPSDGGSLGITTTDRIGSAGYSGTDYTNDFGGTSSAAPLATGVTALILAIDPNLTPTQVRGLLHNTTDYIGPLEYDPTSGFNVEYGYGRLNAKTAVSGVGVAEIQVLDGIVNLADGSGVSDFGNVTIGKTVTKTYRVRNQGTETLNLSGLSVAAPFSIASNLSSTTLDVGQSATFSISFLAPGTGLFSKTLTLTSNDSDEANFDIVVRGNGQTPAIAGTVFNDKNGNGIIDGEPVLAGRTIYFDQNDSAVLDNKDFTNSVGVSIPDFKPSGGSSTVSVTGMSTVSGIKVTVNIAHSYVSDLALTLTNPSGKTIALATNLGDSGNDYTGTVFDDSAAVSIKSGAPPFTGSFRPEEPLSTFFGLPADGTWTLKAVDSSIFDSGSITNWTLTLFEPSTVSDGIGQYKFDDLAAGTYRVRQVLPTNWTETAPTFGSYVVDYTPGVGNPGRDFGSTDVPVVQLNVSVNQAAGQADPTSDKTIHYTAVFTSSVLGFTSSDVIISGTAGVTNIVVTGGGTTYDIAVSGMVYTGTVVVSIPAGIANAGGSKNAVSSSTDNVVTYDGTAPTAVASNIFNITSPTSNPFEFNVTYKDDLLLNTSTIGTGDVRIIGPNGFDVPATLVGLDDVANGKTRFAAYSIDAPNGMWTNAHSGAYSIVLQPDTVSDIVGNSAVGATIGKFNVSIGPTVSAFQINDSADVQRSQVRSLTVTFSNAVTLPATPASAFSLFRAGPGTPNSFVNLSVDTVTLSTPTQTIARITFSGALTENKGSLIDGRYDFKINASQVTFGGVNLDGDGVGGAGGDFVQNIHRLFGDSDGNATVDSDDFTEFRKVFGTTGPSFFDNSADDNVGADDFSEFRKRFGVTI